MKKFKPGKELKPMTKKYKGKYQLLCANCNWIKRHTNKEWRSKR